MKSAGRFVIVLVTAPNLRVARRLAREAVQARHVACANAIPNVESHYWWQGKMESSAEVLILFKTTKSKLVEFEKFILAHHPYDTPEFVVLPFSGGTARYLNWIASSLR